MYLLKNLETVPDTVEFKEIKEKLIKLLQWLGREMSQPERPVSAAYSAFKKEFKPLYKGYQNVIGLNHSVHVISYNKINIQHFLLEQNNGVWKKRYSYNHSTFRDLMKLETVLIIQKNETLFPGQLLLAAFNLLLDYFYCYTNTITGQEWSFTVKEIVDICDSIIEKPVENLITETNPKINKMQVENSLNKMIQQMDKTDEGILKILGKKPHCAECLTQLWKDEEGLSQADKMKLVMYRYNCSKATAIRYMQKFGLWTSREEKKSDKSEVEKLRTEVLRLKKILKENNIDF